MELYFDNGEAVFFKFWTGNHKVYGFTNKCSELTASVINLCRHAPRDRIIQMLHICL